MIITIKYNVNEELYQKAQNHRLLMETKMYAFGSKIATFLSIHAVLRKDLTFYMPELKNGLKSKIYFLENKGNPDEKQPIHQQYFHKLLKEHNLKEPTFYEVLEELNYTDSEGYMSKVNVAILKEGKNKRTAQIEFESEKQYSTFIPPDWLIHINKT